MNDDTLKLDNQLCFKLYTAAREIIKLYTPLLKELDLTYPQYLVMMLLWEREGMTVIEIGKKLHLDSGTLTPLLKKLEKRGYITRVRAEQDERKVVISLTPQGKELKTEAAEIPETIFCTSGLTIESYQRLSEELELLIQRIGDGERVKYCK